MEITFATFLLLAYLSGSISTAIIVCKLLTLPDPRIIGSHNPGATNVLRIGGTKAAVATLIGDITKTVLPLLIATHFSLTTQQLLWIGVSSLLGHCFPVFYRFKGGKGVASMLSVALILFPKCALIALLSWVIIAWTFRRSSIASILTAIILPIFISHFQPSLTIGVAALSFIVLARHWRNIINILNGSEPIIGNRLSKPHNPIHKNNS